MLMKRRIAIVGAGVSGLTCGVLFAERGYRTAIFAKETGQQTTSGAAAALWFPYDAEPAEKLITWALQTYKVLVDLTKNSRSGVSIIELRQFSRTSEIQIPEWAIPLGASVIPTVPALKVVSHSRFRSWIRRSISIISRNVSSMPAARSMATLNLKNSKMSAQFLISSSTAPAS